MYPRGCSGQEAIHNGKFATVSTKATTANLIVVSCQMSGRPKEQELNGNNYSSVGTISSLASFSMWCPLSLFRMNIIIMIPFIAFYPGIMEGFNHTLILCGRGSCLENSFS